MFAPRKASLNDFIDWLKTRDPKEKYDFYDNTGECLMGQYITACGKEYTPASYYDAVGIVHYGSRSKLRLRMTFDRCLFGVFIPAAPIAEQTPWTFGAALKRAKRWRKEHAAVP